MRTAAIAALVLNGLQRVVNLALSLFIFGSLLLFAVQFVPIPALKASWPVVQLHHYGDPIALRLAILTHLTGLKLYMPFLMAVIGYLLTIVSDQLFGLFHNLNHAVRIATTRTERAIAQAPPSKVESEKTREQLYKEYRKIEKQLKEAQRKECTFLSVDVVGSTGMKDGESEIAITATFRAYEELLKRTFKATHAWKESWTPDGVMICFLNREDAVEAGRQILTRLLTFNEHDNVLKTRFDVRCGVNEGEVVVFEDSDLEKLVEHVIDVAGHMQKHAKPGTLLLSKELYEVLQDHTGFQPAEKEVDGYQTYEWAPKA